MKNIREVPARYAATEVGEIPSDWEVKFIGELGKVVRGGSPRPAGDPRFFNGSFIPWLTVAALTTLPENRMEVTETRTCLTREGSEKSRVLPADTVIIANSGATLGVAKILKLRCCANDGIAALIEQREGDKEFLCYYINTQTEYLREVVAPGNGQPNLNTKLIRELPIPFPVEDEQRAISEALSDVDGLITALESLIGKKQAIRQGFMQQLLTGRTRLPGFSNPWREVLLGEHVGYLKAVALSRAQLDGESPTRYLHYGDIHARKSVVLNAAHETMPRVSSALLRNADYLQVGDLVFADASEDPDGVGKSVEVLSVPSTGVVPGLHTIAARFDKAVLADGFKAYLQFIPEFRSALLRLAAGTKVLATTRSFISSIKMTLPDVDEQRAISLVIADADREIHGLVVRLAKARDVKQGMMQQLLTGRTRLSCQSALHE
ncbi:restriction endonuclease subunit S [Streptomyces celluloflavus]|uniref:restriction endonuclease subunit S n=1 Tax=Streptomyces celluloflavus TaxID=58344 RepID=UPI00367838BA